MPIDLVESGTGIVVRGRDGHQLPYSRGIMATSLLATGVPTEEAYRLSSLIQARLLSHDRREVEAHELVELASLTLSEVAGNDDVTNRWIAWRRARQSGRPILIVLGGAPGVGKSTFATRLAVRLNITRVVSTDALREVLRSVVPPEANPDLHVSSFETIDEAANATEPGAGLNRFDRQCAIVAEAATAVAERLATEHRSAIIEGVHAVPGVIAQQLAHHAARPIVVERLVTLDNAQHLAQHLERQAVIEPVHGSEHQLTSMPMLRRIQRHLVDAADAAGVTTVDARSATELTQDIVDAISARV